MRQFGTFKVVKPVSALVSTNNFNFLSLTFRAVKLSPFSGSGLFAESLSLASSVK